MSLSATMSRFRSTLAACVLTLPLGGAINVASAAEVTYVLTIANGRLPESMRRIRVKQNDVVKLQWSTDKPMNVHLHGYDIEKELAPGAVTEMSFTARATGRFTIEPHLAKQPSGGHAHWDILVTIEVYP
jgi:hypothetical protein